ncbi:MAG: LysR substrate-binding domain-containing protein, partial [Phascolarctobacterium sp.]
NQSDSQGIIDGLKDGLFNIGFIGMECQDEEIICRPFCQDRLVLITPVNEHFLALQEEGEAAVTELLKEPLILREKGSGSEKLAEQFLASSGLQEEKLHVVARVNDQEAIKNLVAGGLGVSLISERAAQNFLLEKRLLAFELPACLSARNMYIIYRKDYLLPSYVQEFLRFINIKTNKR